MISQQSLFLSNIYKNFVIFGFNILFCIKTLHYLARYVFFIIEKQFKKFQHYLGSHQLQTYTTGDHVFLKLPSHVACILSSEFILENAICFLELCLSFQIFKVTFYDREGLLKANSDIFLEKMREKGVTVSFVYCNKDEQCVKRKLNDHHGENRVMMVELLDYRDGKEKVLRSIEKSIQNVIVLDQIGKMETINQLFSSAISEPELLFVWDKLSDVLELKGYPPWDIRLTEIFQVKSISGKVHEQGFIDGLMKYSTREKRFGK